MGSSVSTLAVESPQPPPSYSSVLLANAEVVRQLDAEFDSEILSQLFVLMESQRDINSKSVPRWSWTWRDCVIWLFRILKYKFSWTQERAWEQAKRFSGAGPTLYMMDADEWDDLIGGSEGWTIEAMLVAMQREEGAVPPSIDVRPDSDSESEESG